ncbi:MAG: hypothetical protein IJF35_02035 [Clostridia bacterium]|nr:hypothetical protein [Clostridia bacterium]
MKRVIAAALSLLLLCGCAGVSKEPAHTNIGAPMVDYFDGAREISRNPWDMAVLDGKLYIGAGDYDKNTGPINLNAFDIKKREWFDTGLLQDEEISVFRIYDDILYAPGIDPKASWDYGNFYYTKGNEWTTVSNVPGGVHMFDMIRFDGKMFYGLGTGDYFIAPVKMSADGGKTYTNVPFYKDGKLLMTEEGFAYTRVYNFFILKNELYCYFRNYSESADIINKYGKGGIYKFDGSAFQYYDTFFGKISGENISYATIPAAETVGDTLYFTTGKFYKTEDLRTYTEIKMPDESIVTDLLQENGELYVLSRKQQEDGNFKTTIWRYGETPTALYTIDFELGGQSFAKNGTTFYVGMGEKVKDIFIKKRDFIGTIFEVVNIK